MPIPETNTETNGTGTNGTPEPSADPNVRVLAEMVQAAIQQLPAIFSAIAAVKIAEAECEIRVLELKMAYVEKTVGQSLPMEARLNLVISELFPHGAEGHSYIRLSNLHAVDDE
tara:strand:+ start:392 stop:733 length:342 start_codon:yes stop_codon:yes gene_type:complete